MSSFSLKLLAIIFMTIDHIGFILFPTISILRKIGRLAFPIFAFQLSVGFEHTKNKEKHILNLLIFTLISQIPFQFQLYLAFPQAIPTLNIGATLTCGLLALYCIEKFERNWQKCISILFITSLGILIPMDYGWFGILTIVILSFFNKNKLLTTIAYIILICLQCYIKNSIFAVPSIFALIFLAFYNGKKGPTLKYLFYLYYPLHLLILSLIKIYC